MDETTADAPLGMNGLDAGGGHANPTSSSMMGYIRRTREEMPWIESTPYAKTKSRRWYLEGMPKNVYFRYMIALGEYKAQDEQQYYDDEAGLMKVNWPGWNEVATSFSISISQAVDLCGKFKDARIKHLRKQCSLRREPKMVIQGNGDDSANGRGKRMSPSNSKPRKKKIRSMDGQTITVRLPKLQEPVNSNDQHAMLYSWEHCNEIIDYVKVDVVRGEEVLIFRTLWTDGETRFISSDILRQFCKELLLDFYEGRFKLIMKASSMPADDVTR